MTNTKATTPPATAAPLTDFDSVDTVVGVGIIWFELDGAIGIKAAELATKN